MKKLRQQLSKLDTSTGVILLGGQENALSVTRSLGRLGINVCVSADHGCFALKSRYCALPKTTELGVAASDAWHSLLISTHDPELLGRVLFPCSDEAIKFVADNDEVLRRLYLIEETTAKQRFDMLDKKQTIRAAELAGVCTPKIWNIDVDGTPDTQTDVTFPVMVKPIHSHVFAKEFGSKLFIVESGWKELTEKLALASGKGIEVMVVEMVPGPDDLLSSYYTYITSEGVSLYHFTKRVIRRFPAIRGAGCFHETKALPKTKEVGERFFREIGFLGMGNVEFKFDERDQKLKIIEVNGRFTAAQELARRSGAPLDVIAYAHLTRQATPQFDSYREGLRFWYPSRDLKAYLALRKVKQLSFVGWVKSIVRHKRVNPFFAWDDLRPVRAATLNFWKKRMKPR